MLNHVGTIFLDMAIDSGSVLLAQIVMATAAVVVYCLFCGLPFVEPWPSDPPPAKTASSTAKDGSSLEWYRHLNPHDPHSLLRMVKQMRTEGVDDMVLLSEIRAALQHKVFREASVMNVIIQFLVQEEDVDLVDALLEVLSEYDVRPDIASYEVVLECYVSIGNFDAVESLGRRLRAAKVHFSERMRLICVRAALSSKNLHSAAEWLKAKVDLSRPQVRQFVDLCLEKNNVQVLSSLPWVASRVTCGLVNRLLEDCVDTQSSNAIFDMSKVCRVKKNEHCVRLLLARGLDTARVRDLYAELTMEGRLRLAPEMLKACQSNRDANLAATIYRDQPNTSLLSSVLQICVDCGQHHLACELYEAFLPDRLDQDALHLLLSCAQQAGRQDLCASLHRKGGLGKQLAQLRAAGKRRDLGQAKRIYVDLLEHGLATTVVRNCFLDACVLARDVSAATSCFETLRSAHLADVVSYNTLLKGLLQSGQMAKARHLLSAMIPEGVRPNRVTYNEFLNALVNSGDRQGIWSLLDDMRKKCVSPNSVTCSILLKSLNADSSLDDFKKAMEYVDLLPVHEMDEVLLTSVLEACVRAGKLDVLSAKLRQYKACTFKAATYGSIIKAFGQARDLSRVMALWTDMQERGVAPTPMTLGCMVDALVKANQTQEAWRLVHEHPGIANTVVYSTLLKGFARTRQPDQLEAVYHEMQELQVECNVITFNTMIDMHCRCGRMDRVQRLMADMRSLGIRPDSVTTSMIVKGYCGSGNVHEALHALRSAHDFDEVLCVTVLGALARQRHMKEAKQLVEEMLDRGRRPSHHMLALLVKCANDPDVAFRTLDSIARRCALKPNLFVYTALMQLCVQTHQLERAFGVLALMRKDRVSPDKIFFSALLRGCVVAGDWERATQASLLAVDGPGIDHRCTEDVLALALRAGAPAAGLMKVLTRGVLL